MAKEFARASIGFKLLEGGFHGMTNVNVPWTDYTELLAGPTLILPGPKAFIRRNHVGSLQYCVLILNNLIY